MLGVFIPIFAIKAALQCVVQFRNVFADYAHHARGMSMFRDWIDWLGGERILELYGGTEAQAITFITGDEWVARRGSVGRVLLGEMVVLDASGNELPPGEIGEIWMRRGPDEPPAYRYVGAQPRSRPGNWESLGDMGWKDADGYVYLSDRDTDMILVGGANVYPAEVESALDEHPAVRSSCVIGLPDDEYGNVVHAIVQASGPLTPAELEEFLREKLTKYKRPRTYEFVGEPLRGDDGKVRRSALRAQRLAQRGGSASVLLEAANPVDLRLGHRPGRRPRRARVHVNPPLQ